jgi:dTDP-4-dehydrorhamnose reductase
MRLLVFGGRGQLGVDLAGIAEQKGHEVIRPTRREVDVIDDIAVRDAVLGAHPDAVVNAAAFHQVEACDADPATAFAVNSVGALNVARAARDALARSIYVSTDYVFDGESPDGYEEDDPVRPLNVYGVSKAAGELLVALADRAALVVRVSGLFGHAGSSGKGGNFVEKMLARARLQEPVFVTSRFVFSPTSTRDMVERLLALLELVAPPGSYHLSNSGRCSWFEFAARIFELSRIVVPLAERVEDDSEDDSKVRRPRCSVLVDTKTGALGLPPAPHWEDALARYLAERSSQTLRIG